MSTIIKTTKKPETYRDPKDLVGNLANGFARLLEDDGYTHVVPDMDTRLHILFKTKCWCGPIEHEGFQIEHFADDDREKYFLGIKKRY